MTSSKDITTKCPCCGRHFEKLTQLLEHVKMNHTADEILAATSESEAAAYVA